MNDLKEHMNKEKEELFYVQDLERSYRNCASWWKPNSMGYTQDVREAGKYTRAQVEALDPDCLGWPTKDIEAIVMHLVDFDSMAFELKVEPIRGGKKWE